MGREHPRCAVVGAANIDIGGFSAARLVPGDSNPGRIRLSAGGVGRNIACNLARMGVETHLVAGLGADAFADVIRADCAAAGVSLDLALAFPDAASSSYLFIADETGDMELAVNDMGVCDRLTPAVLKTRLDALNAMDAVVLDANLSQEALAYLAENLTAPLIADAVSAAKAHRLLPVLHRLRVFKPNALEAEALTGVAVRDIGSAENAARRLADMGAQSVFVTLGARGVCCADADRAVYLPPAALQELPSMVNATGAGDAFTAALAWSLLTAPTPDIREAAIAGIAAATLAMESEETVNPRLTRERLAARTALISAQYSTRAQ